MKTNMMKNRHITKVEGCWVGEVMWLIKGETKIRQPAPNTFRGFLPVKPEKLFAKNKTNAIKPPSKPVSLNPGKKPGQAPYSQKPRRLICGAF